MTRLSPFFTALLVAWIGVACAGDDSVPTQLMDGSKVRAPPIELRGIGRHVVLTKARLVAAEAVEPGSGAEACLRSRLRDARPTSALVERVGVNGETVTVRDAFGLHACDNSPGLREKSRRWCGGAFGRLYRGHLRDPRLDIICESDEGAPMGFAWVEMRRDARYLVVRQAGYGEVYEAAGGLPVRIATTTGVSIEDARATFELSEHDFQGRLLRRFRLDAAVAG